MGIGMKTYKIIINHNETEVPAKALDISRKRVISYFHLLLKKIEKKPGFLRLFWSDIIMFNILTTKMLKNTDPIVINQIINPFVEDEDHE